jgi:hypothetical protein
MRTALGFRPHTGWTCAVALAGDVSAPAVVARRRLELSDPAVPWQPYQAASQLRPDAAMDLVREAERVAGEVTAAALGALLAELHAAGHEVVGAVVPSGRSALPDTVPRTLASHPLMHAAEGELFRDALVGAATEHGLRVVRAPAEGLREEVCAELGCSEDALGALLAGLGRAVGPPWRQDEKEGTLAAWIGLAAPAGVT